MQFGNAQNNRKAQATPLLPAPRHTVKSIKHPLLQVRGNTRPAVGDPKNDSLIDGFDGGRYLATLKGIANRIIKQIAQHDPKKISVPVHNRPTTKHVSGPQIDTIGCGFRRY